MVVTSYPSGVKTSQYNGLSDVDSIGLLKRSIPALDGSHRRGHSRYDRRRDGFPAHSVLRDEAEGLTDDGWDDHCVILRGPTYFSAAMGPRIRSLRPPADSFDQPLCIDRCVLCLRFCEGDVAIVLLSNCARSRRRHECGDDAGACYRFVRHILGPAVARYSRRLSVLGERALRVEVASRVQTA